MTYLGHRVHGFLDSGSRRDVIKLGREGIAARRLARRAPTRCYRQSLRTSALIAKRLLTYRRLRNRVMRHGPDWLTRAWRQEGRASHAIILRS
jgi:hypothetical protein